MDEVYTSSTGVPGALILFSVLRILKSMSSNDPSNKPELL
jgi:hypothetical protein